ncbi:SLC26A/SulP transporter family protein [Candidatus Omnitrophota bacterium]
MNKHKGQTRQNTVSLTEDFWGGLAAMLVALPSSIAFGVLVYTAIGPEYAGQGAMAGMVGAAVLGIVAPIFGGTGGLISAPCAPAAAVMSALVAGLLAGRIGVVDPSHIPMLVAMTALLSALLQIFYGIIGGGRLIKFIPYPVVNGYLSGVGVLIALGQLPKLFGLPKDTSLISGLTSPGTWKWQGLVVGLVTMAVMSIAPHITKKVPAAILGLLGGIASYFILASFSPGLLELSGNPLVIGPIEVSGSFIDSFTGRIASIFSVDFVSIRLLFIPALTLSVLLSIDTLQTCIVVDGITRSRHNSNRELIGQGIGNLASFLAGGMPGAGTTGPTLINVTSGGRTPRSGIIEGVFVVMVLLILGRLIAWVPIGALAGILLIIAWRMFDKTMFRLLRHPAGRLDFAVIAGVILVAVAVDLIAASGAGIALAILLFIRDQTRSSVIRRKMYLNQMSSKTRRLAPERKALKKHGDQGVFCELSGNLFFGTTDQLYSQLEPDIRTKRFILFDMRRVQSMDYTAAHLFGQIQSELEERDGRLLFSGMPSTLHNQHDFERYLAEMGVVSEEGGVLISETLDGALEWMEERILHYAGLTKIGKEKLIKVKNIDLFQGFDKKTIASLTKCMHELQVPQGQRIFSLGDKAEEMYIVRRGSVRIMLPLEGGKRHHLATIGRGVFFGEISFLDRGVRSADIEAKVPTDLYVLSQKAFDRQTQSDADFGVQVYSRLALAIADRLRQADDELRVLEER